MDRNAPADSSWVVAIYESPDSAEPMGGGVVLSADKVLTCAHVLGSKLPAGIYRDRIWIAFPWTDSWIGPRIPATVEAIRTPSEQDVALLRLDQRIPAGVRLPVPIKCPRPQDLAGRRWWSFGFPSGDPIGAESRGTVGVALSYDWMQLEHDPEAASFIGSGYSGAGLWVPEYGVVGLVGFANPVSRSARAISLYRLDQLLPEAKIRVHARWSAVEAGEGAHAAWGWALADDPEAGQHWRPRARGVSVESERGFRFRGRTAALTRIKDWLDRPFPDSRALVVTGSPGSGKSAVLGRIVTTADAQVVKALPSDDRAVRATLGSVGCAVHAKGKTALDVAREIARAASAPLPERADQLADHLRDTLANGPRAPFNIVVDALDEAAGADQAIEIVDAVIRPVLETCTEFGVQIVVGTRRDLLGHLGDSTQIIDLDDAGYVAMDDLTAYATATLRLLGAERAGNPYQDIEIAEPVAERIASLADRNFLVAGLVARTHGMYDETAVDPAEIQFTPTVAAALAEYVKRLPNSDRVPARWALTALAFAEAPGFTITLWRLALHAISGIEASEEALSRFALSPAANFLIESVQGAARAYRLYHQALDDTLLAARADQTPRTRDETAIYEAFTAYGRANQWKSVPEYLLRALPNHASAANRVDDLLMDEDYLLRADLRRVVGIGELAQSPEGEKRAQLLRQTPQEADESSPHERAAMFSVTEQLERLGDTFARHAVLSPYMVAWADTQPAAGKATTFLSNWSDGDGGIAPVTVAGRTLLAVANGGAVWLWEPLSGRCEQQLGDPAAAAAVVALLPIRADGQTLLASVHVDWRVRIWDIENQSCRGDSEVGEESEYHVESAVVIEFDGREQLAISDDKGLIRIWDPRAAGYALATTVPKTIRHRARRIRRLALSRLAAVTVNGRPRVAVGDRFGFVYLFDPATRSWTSRRAFGARRISRSDAEEIYELTAVDAQGVAVEGTSGLWLWEPESGRRTLMHADDRYLFALAAVGLGASSALVRYGNRTIQVSQTSPWMYLGAFSQRMGELAHVQGVVVNGKPAVAFVDEGGNISVQYLADVRRQALGSGSYAAATWAVYSSGDERFIVVKEESSYSSSWPSVVDPVLGIKEGWTDSGTAWQPICGAHFGADLGVFCTIYHGIVMWRPGVSSELIRIAREGDGQPSLSNVLSMAVVEVNGRRQLAALASDSVFSTQLALIELELGDSQFLRQMGPELSMPRFLSSGPPAFVRMRSGCDLAYAEPEGHGYVVKVVDPLTDRELGTHGVTAETVDGLFSFDLGDMSLLAIAMDGGKVQVWRPSDDTVFCETKIHRGAITALCPVRIDSRDLVASGGTDSAVRIWDPLTGEHVQTIPVHYPIGSLAFERGILAVALPTGVLALDLDRAAAAAAAAAAADRHSA